MRTLTFEQLRINLTLTFDTLDEPIEIVKRGKVVGYLVSNLQDHKGTGKAEKQEGNDMPAVKIVPVTSPGEAEKPVSKPDVAETVYEPDPARPVKQPKASSKAAPIVKSLLSGIVKQPIVSHHPQCSCACCKP